MKVSLKWLREYVQWTVPVDELAHRLTMAGDEVESIHRIGADWEGVVVGEIVRLAPHPNADRLLLATVDLGGRQQTVVTGAPNLAIGLRVPFAPVGTLLIDGTTGERKRLKAAKIRGIESAGMVCSAKELGLGDDHSGILILPPDAPVGTPLSDLYGDVIFEFKTTPNRPDLLSMLGVAWEVSALTGSPVQAPPLDHPVVEPGIAAQFSVRIDDPDLCGRYSAALVRGVQIGESPRWLRERLEAAGMRPINNVVDITNYVMLEFGQPMHAFDAATIAQNTIIVRRAREGERLTTLDGVERELDPSMLVIADAERAIALAGVMGGLDTEVTERTTEILLESANFHNYTIRRTARRLRMRSEASTRFEKGISPELTIPALQRACRLLTEIAGGRVAAGFLDVYPGCVPLEPRPLSSADVARVLGVTWPLERIEQIFRSLGATVERHGAQLLITPPPWRRDLNLTEDLVEEVARIIGYDELPATGLRGEVPATPPDPVMATSERLRDLMVAAGLQEVITYPLVSRELLTRAGPVPEPIALLNPMTSDQSVLRTSMRPSVLKTIADNSRRQEDGLALFEIGLIYLPRENDLPEERPLLAFALAGPRGRSSWLGVNEPYDFFDGKGIVEAIGERQRLSLSFARSSDPFYHPGRAAEVRRDGILIGTVGEVAPEVCAAFDLSGRVVYGELEVRALVSDTIPIYQPVSRFPDVVQDLAIVVDEPVEAEQIRSLLASGRYVQEVRLFDVYRGAPLAAGKKSLAFTLRFRAPDRTLTEEEVSRIRTGLVEQLAQRFGATLRS
ncbi:MAG: phenylalanine--tRNA ligase subunit beta [Chloroflexota bacterium]|nr:phenylalanine--tRNA ligase subunit beta [Dehalococcoidia bacterium]MDW8253529.1 phenylalanine--tRNA ligase subunit beta [Chloroflexota bacterium]